MAWWRQRRKRHDRDDDLTDEIRAHLEMATRDRIERGEQPDVAAGAARREFGNVGLIKEITREMWGWASIARFWRDLRYGLRLLRRNPSFTAVAVLSLALGIGANTAMFTVVESVLLRPLPYREPERLVMVYSVGSFGPFSFSDGPFFDPDYLECRKLTAFSDLAAFGGSEVSIVDAADPSRLQGSAVTASLFPLLGVQAALGRVFDTHEEASHATVAVLSDTVWRTRYQTDRNVIGRLVKIDGVTHTIIGVMPAAFNFPAKTAIWTPLRLRPDYRRNAFNRVVGRLASGITPEQASREVEALLRATGQSLPAQERVERVAIVDLRTSISGGVRWLLLILFGAVGCVILIACTNVASLLMARAAARGREMSIRTSLGAGRGRLVRQLLTESVALALTGGMIGLVLAYAGLPAILSWVPPDMLPRINEVRLNTTDLGFTFLLCLTSGLAFGLMPALSSSRAETAHMHHLRTLRGSTPTERRFRGLLVVVQTALVLVLLIGAGLLLKSFWRLQRVDPGFRRDRLLTMTVSLPELTYRTVEQKRGFYDRLLQRVEALPFVEDHAAINLLPFGIFGWRGDFEVEGHEAKPNPLIVGKPAVSERYFQALGIPLRQGRFFAPGDDAGAPPVAIVSEIVARACWPDRDPLGQRINMDDPSKRRWLTVVGVVGDVRQDNLANAPQPMIYVPIRQELRGFFLETMTFVARPRAEVDGVAAALRAQVRALDAELPVQRIARFDQIMATSVAEPRFRTGLLLTFALLALVLALIGIYGIVSHEVVRRTSELGIRRALGARTADVIWLVIGRTAALVLIGLAVGITAASAATRVLEAFLFAVEPTDATTFMLVSAGLATVAMIASLIPARRALRVDPAVALRHE